MGRLTTREADNVGRALARRGMPWRGEPALDFAMAAATVGAITSHIRSPSADGCAYRRYNVGTTTMFSSVDVISPQRITIAIGV